MYLHDPADAIREAVSSRLGDTRDSEAIRRTFRVVDRWDRGEEVLCDQCGILTDPSEVPHCDEHHWCPEHAAQCPEDCRDCARAQADADAEQYAEMCADEDRGGVS